MKLSDVVRGVEEKDLSGYREGHGRGSEGHYLEYGYNSLASAEVVVDIVAIGQALRKNLDTFPIDANWTMLRERGIDYQNLIGRSITAIATAIESGSIISLKEE